jgi:hypothetical protein
MNDINISTLESRSSLLPGRSSQGHLLWAPTQTTQQSREDKAERRLWKISLKSDSSVFRLIESLAFVLLGAAAILAIGCSWSELSHLVMTGSLEHMTQRFLTTVPHALPN